jgi:ABC-type transporter Mla MlaB component
VPSLPQNFVARPTALKEVKDLLLRESKRTLVVSAIAGLGGLGKSVLATAIEIDPEVQERFKDGTLWVTLGQSPDLQSCLGTWIRALDKSRESFSAMTLESAKGYLHNLLAERRMLLVVDDVWNAAHAEWFRVGGSGCRVLMTTREAIILGSERYPLDLMSRDESLELVRGVLGEKWAEAMEKPALEFAKFLGYLPLALQLMAIQVVRGRKWETLKKAFLKEANRLSMLDRPGVRLSELSEEERRQYSLQACFQVSLDRLKEDRPAFYDRFAWVGVLPEDVEIGQRTAMVLWNVEDWEAEETLLELYERSFLTLSVTIFEGESTYRVHDLMHWTAQGLIEKGEVRVENLVEAHRSFLERYRGQCVNGQWFRPPYNRDKPYEYLYFYRYLTWHLEQADWADEIHALMAASDERGRNAWFEACHRVGLPSVFVEDVARGWRMAEEKYEEDLGKAVVLQYTYALVTSTLTSFSDSLSIVMMMKFIEYNFWTVEQSWAYIEQMQDQEKLVHAIQSIAPYLSKLLFQAAIVKTQSISEDRQVDVLSGLTMYANADFSKLLEATRLIKTKHLKAEVLINLAQVNSSCLPTALEAVEAVELTYLKPRLRRRLTEISKKSYKLSKPMKSQKSREELGFVDSSWQDTVDTDFNQWIELYSSGGLIQDVQAQALALWRLCKINSSYCSKALEAVRLIQDESIGAELLISLAQISNVDSIQLLKTTQLIQDSYSRARVLSELAKFNSAYFPEALNATRLIGNEYSRAEILSELAKLDSSCFPEALRAACSIQDEDDRARVLSELAKLDSADFSQLLKAARLIKAKGPRAKLLLALAKFDGTYFSEALRAAQLIQDEYNRSIVLSGLANLDSADFAQLFEASQSIQDEDDRASVLCKLAKLDSADFSQLFEAARSIQDEGPRAKLLLALAKFDYTYLSEALRAARSIQGYDRAIALNELTNLDPADFSQLFETVQSIQDEDDRALVLCKLAELDSADFSKLLEAAQSIQDENDRASVLRKLAELDSADFPQLLEAVRSIQDEYSRAIILCELVELDSANFPQLFEAAQSIQDEGRRASILCELAALDSADFLQLFEAAQSIQDEGRRASILCELAALDSADFLQLFKAAQSTQDKLRQRAVLIKLAEYAPKDFLPIFYPYIFETTLRCTSVQDLSSYLASFNLEYLSYSDWKTHLHLLAHRKRADLMGDLATLYPAIVHLGQGEAAMRGVVEEMKRVCEQWP